MSRPDDRPVPGTVPLGELLSGERVARVDAHTAVINRLAGVPVVPDDVYLPLTVTITAGELLERVREVVEHYKVHVGTPDFVTVPYHAARNAALLVERLHMACGGHDSATQLPHLDLTRMPSYCEVKCCGVQVLCGPRWGAGEWSRA